MRQRYLLLFFLLFLMAGSGCKRHSPESAVEARPPARVRVLAVAEQAAGRQQEVSGTVEAVQHATIAAKVSGVIEEVPVALGAEVKKGALLVRIGAGEIAARVMQAEARLGQAKRNMERERRLMAKDASTPETVRLMEEAYRVAEADAREARTMHGYTAITAPFGGKISQKMVHAGDLATPGQPLLVLEGSGGLQVVAAVPEALMPQIKMGETLPVAIPAAGFDGKGTVAEIAAASDVATRTALVKLSVSGGADLRPGQYARVGLPGAATVNTLLVPAAAVATFGQMERLYVVQNNVAQLRLVRTGERHGDQVEILAGLTPGEKVVVQGQEHLLDGQAVRVVP
ncbi:MAG: efflux RND transporter periplasmic adaptor subunit [Thermodesulfobacteriota bacterium]